MCIQLVFKLFFSVRICVAKHLISPDSYTGNHALLLSYKRSDKGDPLAKIRLQVGELDNKVVVAISEDLTDEALLGSDLGFSNLGDWLKFAEGNQVCITRAQSEAKVELEVDDQKALVESQTSSHLLSDVFDFDSELFQDDTARATPPTLTPSILLHLLYSPYLT